MAGEKIRLDVVIFEADEEKASKNTHVRTSGGDKDKEPKKPVTKKMLFSREEIEKLNLRKYDNNRPEFAPQNWSVLFDRLKDPQTVIIVATPFEDLERQLTLLGIIKVLS